MVKQGLWTKRPDSAFQGLNAKLEKIFVIMFAAWIAHTKLSLLKIFVLSLLITIFRAEAWAEDVCGGPSGCTILIEAVTVKPSNSSVLPSTQDATGGNHGTKERYDNVVDGFGTPSHTLDSYRTGNPRNLLAANRCIVPTINTGNLPVTAIRPSQCVQPSATDIMPKGQLTTAYCPCTSLPIFRYEAYLMNPANGGGLCLLECPVGHRCSRFALDQAKASSARSDGAYELASLYSSLGPAYGLCVPCIIGEYCEEGSIELNAADTAECEVKAREAAHSFLQHNNLVMGGPFNSTNFTLPVSVQAPPGLPVPPGFQAPPEFPGGVNGSAPGGLGRRLLQNSDDSLVFKQCNSLMLCPPGHYCPTPAEKIPCQEGEFCSGASVFPRTCNLVDALRANPFTTVWAPPKFLFQSAQESRMPLLGNYCPAQSSSPFGKCGKGNTCPVPTRSQECKKGQYCPEGSYQPRRCTFLFKCDSGSSKARWGWGGMLILAVILVSIVVVFHLLIRSRAKQVAQRQKGENLIAFVTSLGFYVGRKSNISPNLWTRFCGLFKREETRSSLDSNRSLLRVGEGAEGYGVIEVHLSVEFRNLTLMIGNGKTCVLKDVTGEFPHSQMHALMGPSGCGKSTFMNTLCGKASYGKTTGQVAIKEYSSDGIGKVHSFESLRYITGYVPQEDIVHEVLTVRENLFFAAKLRLPRHTHKEEVYDVVNCVLQLLGLAHVEHSVVGSVETRGISGGQRKRVNIGMELVARPSLLFLDEPTSGLDSAVSHDVLDSLRKMTHSGMNVIMVIHQPRYSIFEMFDSVLLLGVGGRTVFLGPVVFALPYFTSLGFALPRNENPADFYLDVISGAVSRVDDEDFVPNQLFDLWVERGELWVKEQKDAIATGQQSSLDLEQVSVTVGGNFLARSWPWRPRDLQTIHDRFNFLDANHDGFLNFEEFKEFWAGLRDVMSSEEYAAFVDDMIVDFSINDNQVVTRESFMATVKAKLRQAAGEDVEGGTPMLNTMKTMDRNKLVKEMLEKQRGSRTRVNLQGSGIAMRGVMGGMVEGMHSMQQRASIQNVSATARSAGSMMGQEAWGTLAMMAGWSAGGRALPTVWRQIYLVILRDRTKALNDWVTFLLDIFLLAFFAVLIALVQGDTSNIIRLTSPLAMMLASLALLMSVTGLRTFGQDNVIFLQRESLGGLSTTAYTIGHMLWDVFYMLPRPIIFMVFYLFMLWPEALSNQKLFVKLVGVVLLVAWYAYSFGYMMAVLLSKHVAMVAAAGLPLIFGAIINGLNPRLSEVNPGDPMDILNHLSYGRWAIEAIIISVAKSVYTNPAEAPLIYGYFTATGFCGGLKDVPDFEEAQARKNGTRVASPPPPPPGPWTPDMALPLGNIFVGSGKSMEGGKPLSGSNNQQIKDLSKVVFFYNHYEQELAHCRSYFALALLWLFWLGLIGRVVTILVIKYKVMTRATK